MREWSELDPAIVAAPAVERAARADAKLTPDPSDFNGQDAAHAQRLLFFRQWAPQGVDHEAVRAYRYFDECRAAMEATQDLPKERFLERILLGLSHVLGAPGYSSAGLTLNDRIEPGGRWAVLKEFPAEEFEVDRVVAASPYLETTSDAMRLTHSGGAQLLLTLDTVELVLRCADGELLGDAASLTIRREIEGFAADLRRQPSEAVRIVDSTGQAIRAVLSDGIITREHA